MRFPNSLHTEREAAQPPFMLSAHGPQERADAANPPGRSRTLTWALVGTAMAMLAMAVHLALRPAEPVDPVWSLGSPGAGSHAAAASVDPVWAARHTEPEDLSPGLADEKASALAEAAPGPSAWPARLQQPQPQIQPEPAQGQATPPTRRTSELTPVRPSVAAPEPVEPTPIEPSPAELPSVAPIRPPAAAAPASAPSSAPPAALPASAPSSAPASAVAA